MKYLLFIIISLSAVHFEGHLYAQEVYGTVTYYTKPNLQESDEEIIIGVSSDMAELVKEKSANEAEQAYSLDFNESSSYYKKNTVEAKKNKPDDIIIIDMDEFNAEHYMNLKEGIIIGQLTLFGETYIISSSPRNFTWKIEDETKVIQHHTCRKATCILKGEVLPDGSYTDDTIIIAWYATNIQVGFGPESYWGLPGLILEIDNGTKIITCSKITLNPKEKPIINPPSSGKKVTKEELIGILGEMLKE